MYLKYIFETYVSSEYKVRKPRTFILLSASRPNRSSAPIGRKFVEGAKLWNSNRLYKMSERARASGIPRVRSLSRAYGSSGGKQQQAVEDGL